MNTSRFEITHIKTPISVFNTDSSFPEVEYYYDEKWFINSKKYQNMSIRPKLIRWIKDKNHYRLEINSHWNNIYYSTIFNSKNLEKYMKIEESRKHSLEIYRILMQDFIKRIGIDYGCKRISSYEK